MAFSTDADDRSPQVGMAGVALLACPDTAWLWWSVHAGAARLMESLSIGRVPHGIQPAHLHAVLRVTYIRANIVKARICLLSLNDRSRLAPYPGGEHVSTRNSVCGSGLTTGEGRACMPFTSTKRRSGVTKGQANREAFVQSTSYEQKLLRVDPAGQCICILLSSEETEFRVALVSEPNRVDGFGICRIAVDSIKSSRAALWKRLRILFRLSSSFFVLVLLCFPASFSNLSFPSANKASDSCCCSAA